MAIQNTASSDNFQKWRINTNKITAFFNDAGGDHLIKQNDATTSTNTTTGSITTSGGIGVEKNVSVGGYVGITGNSALKIPSGSISERPLPTYGMVRINTDTNSFEYYTTNWRGVGSNLTDGDGDTRINLGADTDADTITIFTGEDGNVSTERLKINSISISTNVANVIINQTLNVTGNTDIATDLNVTGNVNITTDLTVTGNTDITTDLNVTGNTDITGNLTVDGTVTFNAGVSGDITIGTDDGDGLIINADLKSNIIPNSNNVYALGNTTNRFTTSYFSGDLIANGVVGNDSNTSLNIPPGNTDNRDSGPVSGAIRFNNETNFFEGYYNSTWYDVGGVKDADQDTYIISDPNDYDILRFNIGTPSGSQETMTLNATTLGVDASVIISGNLQVLGSSFTVSSTDLSVQDHLIYLNGPGDLTDTTFTGTGVSDAIFYGYYEGFSSSATYKVEIVSNTSSPDTFRWYIDDVEQANNVSITGSTQSLSDNIYIRFDGGVDGYTVGDYWEVSVAPQEIDLGIVGNYNNGSVYAHTGIFRDATDGTYKVFYNYLLEPDDTININTDYPTSGFTLADFAAENITANSSLTANSIILSGIAEITGTVNIKSSTASTSSTTGALRVNGGVGIGNNLIVGSSAETTSNSSGALVVTGGLGVGGNTVIGGGLSIENTTDSTTNSSGSLVVSGGMGVSLDTFIGGAVKIESTTVSSSNTTGALIVGGGAGIGGNTTIGGSIKSYNDTVANTTDGGLYIAGGARIDNNLSIGNTGTLDSIVSSGGATLAGQVYIQDTTVATAANTGALRIEGGLSVIGDSYFGGGIDLNSNTTITASSSVYDGTPGSLTGALVVDGGGYFSNNMYIGGNTYFNDSTASANTTTGAVVVVGGIGVGANSTFGGDVTITGALTETSSIRYKENIVELNTLDYEKILDLNPVSYIKKNTRKKEVGLIAEEVYELIPDIVTQNTEKEPEGVQYTRLIPYMIKLIQKQQKDIVNLKSLLEKK